MAVQALKKQATADDGGKTWGDILEDKLEAAANEKKHGRIVIKKKDMTWEEDKFVRSALVVSSFTGFKLKTIHAWLGEILPGANTGKHRHTSEAALFCLSGAGYSVIDGVRHDWVEGDAIKPQEKLRAKAC